MRPVGLAVLAGCEPPMLPEVADPCAVWDEPGLYRFEVEVKGDTRKAYVDVPPHEGPRPLVVALHGGGQPADRFADVSQHLKLGEREGFVAVYPRGKKDLLFPVWNVGNCCSSVDDEHRAIDDVAFLDALVRKLSPEVCGEGVLATGFSNGAMMTHRWACEGETVDAAVTSSGPHMADPSACGGEPVPIRHYHGTADPIVPYDGDEEYRSVDETMALWRERNRCDDTPPVTWLADGTTTCIGWTCAAPTELCTLDGWAHQWPGGANAASTGGVDATADGWAFYRSTLPATEAQ